MEILMDLVDAYNEDLLKVYNNQKLEHALCFWLFMVMFFPGDRFFFSLDPLGGAGSQVELMIKPKGSQDNDCKVITAKDPSSKKRPKEWLSKVQRVTQQTEIGWSNTMAGL